MGLFGKMFNRKKAAVKIAAARIENKDLMEAIVGGQLLLAYSNDRKLDDDERSQIEELLRTNSKLEVFGGEVIEYFRKTNDALKAGYITSRVRILREIGEVARDRNDAVDVLANVLEVALHDGSISDAEEKELIAIATALNLNLKDYLV